MRVLRLLCSLACLLLLFVQAASANGTITTQTITTARTEIWKDLNTGAIGSAAIAIMDKGKVVYSEGFGMADREKSIPVNKKTIFDIGSVSKIYVATAIMVLVDEGKVALDAPASKYLPDFSMVDERYKDITVRMLLNHSSGLPGTTGENNFGFAFNQDVYKDTLDALASSQLKHRPGESSIYCNDGFTLAEMIVARVSGQSYLEFLQERLFQPLALHNTGAGVGQRQPALGGNIAKFYPPGKAFSEPLEVLSLLGAGGLSSSAEDLCRFVDTFSGKGPQILTAASLGEIKKEQPPSFRGKLRGPDIPWGLGWDVTTYEPYKANGIKVLGKGGNSSTYTAQVFTAPDLRISVAVVSTGRAGGALPIADKVLQAYLASNALLKLPAKPVTPPVKAQPIPLDLKRFEGFYANGNEVFQVSLDAPNGVMTLYNNAKAPTLSAVYNNGFFYKDERKLYFEEIDKTSYLVLYVDAFKGDGIYLEKLASCETPQQLEIPIEGKKWLRRNVKAFEGTSSVPDHITESHVLPDLPGYIDFCGIKKVISPSFAGMAIQTSRDLTELHLIQKDNQFWARSGGSLFMPADLADLLSPGTTTHALNTNGYNQWFKIVTDSILRCEKSTQGRMIVFAPDNAVLFDSAVDTGDVFTPSGSFVEIAGAVGDAFKLTLQTAPSK